jgi:hypothetical protein
VSRSYDSDEPYSKLEVQPDRPICRDHETPLKKDKAASVSSLFQAGAMALGEAPLRHAVLKNETVFRERSF